MKRIMLLVLLLSNVFITFEDACAEDTDATKQISGEACVCGDTASCEAGNYCVSASGSQKCLALCDKDVLIEEECLIATGAAATCTLNQILIGNVCTDVPQCGNKEADILRDIDQICLCDGYLCRKDYVCLEDGCISITDQSLQCEKNDEAKLDEPCNCVNVFCKKGSICTEEGKCIAPPSEDSAFTAKMSLALLVIFALIL